VLRLHQEGYKQEPSLPVISVVGGTGFVGSYLVLDLLQMGYSLHLLVNQTDSGLVSPRERIKSFKGSIENEQAMCECFKGSDIVYHLVGLIAETRRKTFKGTVAEGTAKLVNAAHKAGVKKIIYLSALGVAEDSPSAYFRTKWDAEQHVINSGLDYTIFRPSIIYGLEDKFINRIARMVKWMPLVPVIGNGKYRFQPVYVEELCAIMAKTSAADFTSHKIYEIGGARALTYDEIIDIIKRILNYRRKTIHLPVSLMRLIATILMVVSKPAPLTVDQINMMQTDSICDSSLAERDFGVKFSSFENQLSKYLRR